MNLNIPLLKAEIQSDITDLKTDLTILQNIECFVEQQTKLGAFAELQSDIDGNLIIHVQLANVSFDRVSVVPNAEFQSTLPGAQPVVVPEPEIDVVPPAPVVDALEPEIEVTSPAPVVASVVPDTAVDVPQKTETPVEFVTGDLSTVEIDTILKMEDAGKGSGAIAKALNRDPRGFYHCVKRVFQQSRSGELDIAPAPPAQAPFLDQGMAAHLDKVGNSNVWTAQRDFHVVLAMQNNASLRVISKDVNIEKEDIFARWETLCPNRNDQNFRARLLAELKFRMQKLDVKG